MDTRDLLVMMISRKKKENLKNDFALVWSVSFLLNVNLLIYCCSIIENLSIKFKVPI